MADIDLQPTQQMADNAARGLELRAKHGKGGTAVGVARARDIKNRANLSAETVKRMHSFFSRHEGNQAGGEDDAGYIAWLLWGGDAGKAWSKRKVEQINGKVENSMNASNDQNSNQQLAASVSRAVARVHDLLKFCEEQKRKYTSNISRLHKLAENMEVARKNKDFYFFADLTHSYNERSYASLFSSGGHHVPWLASHEVQAKEFIVRMNDLIRRHELSIKEIDKGIAALNRLIPKFAEALQLQDYEAVSQLKQKSWEVELRVTGQVRLRLPKSFTRTKNRFGQMSALLAQIESQAVDAAFKSSRPGAKVKFSSNPYIAAAIKKAENLRLVAKDLIAALSSGNKEEARRIVSGMRYAVENIDTHIKAFMSSRPGAKAAFSVSSMLDMIESQSHDQRDLAKSNLRKLAENIGYMDHTRQEWDRYVRVAKSLGYTESQIAGFSRPGAKVAFAISIDRRSIERWEQQYGRKITSGGRGTWAFIDPHGETILVPHVMSFADAAKWLKANGKEDGEYKVGMSRAGAKAAMSRPGEADAFALGAASEATRPEHDESLTALAAKVGREHTVSLFKRWAEGKASMSRKS